MWPFRRKPAPEPEYRWSVEAKLEQIVMRATQRDALKRIGPRLLAMQQAMMQQQGMGARASLLQASVPCQRCGQFHPGMTCETAWCLARGTLGGIV
jgi:hypothetical protein